MWGSTFPRLYELYCADPLNPNNYFNSPNCQSAVQQDPPDEYLTDLESILKEIDPAAWHEWKERAAHSLSVEKRFGFPLPLFDCFNEARAYVFLKQQGNIHITFLKPGQKNPKKLPDLLARDGDGFITLLEAKRIHDSTDEIAYLVNPSPQDMRTVSHGLKGKLRAKVSSTVDKARGQLLAYRDEQVSRRIVYLSIRIDSQNATHKTRDDLGLFLEKLNDSTIEIVWFIENTFLL